jgi:ribonuclease P protein component
MDGVLASSTLVSLRRPEDFKRLLGSRPLARHAGWTLHGQWVGSAELSTGEAMCHEAPVDDLQVGLIVARRSVRRAVTRNLIRRVWKELLRREAGFAWRGWQLVLRRTAAWDKEALPSASSDAARCRIRAELAELLSLAWRRDRSNRPAAA